LSCHIAPVEVAGEIEKVGKGIDGWKPGDRVNPYIMGTCGECRFCRTGRESLCLTPRFISFAYGGGYAERVSCSARQLVRIPEGVSYEAAAALQVAFATSWHMLYTRAKLRPGETVLVNSVGSGIGSAAIRLAKLAGAFVIGNAGGEKLDRARTSAGRRHQPPDAGRRRGGPAHHRREGVDVVYEHVGGEI
jgi:D-arabinose 1-dehydrogenase-like Zn-dependent alcohol dehydrogenase